MQTRFELDAREFPGVDLTGEAARTRFARLASRRQLLKAGAGGALALGGLAVAGRSARQASAAGELPAVAAAALNYARGAMYEQVAAEYSLFLSGLTETDQKSVKTVTKKVKKVGFVNFTYAVVYGNILLPVAFYPVLHDDGLNGAVPIFSSCYDKASVVYGPVIVALWLATEDWYDKEVTPHKALTPREETKKDTADSFQKSMRDPFVANTDSGVLSVLYDAAPKSQTGRIEVLSREVNGREIFNGAYEIKFQV